MRGEKIRMKGTINGKIAWTMNQCSHKTFVHLEQHTNRWSFIEVQIIDFAKFIFVFICRKVCCLFQRLTNRNIKFLESWQTLRINKRKWSFTLFVEQAMKWPLTSPCRDLCLTPDWPAHDPLAGSVHKWFLNGFLCAQQLWVSLQKHNKHQKRQLTYLHCKKDCGSFLFCSLWKLKERIFS